MIDQGWLRKLKKVQKKCEGNSPNRDICIGYVGRVGMNKFGSSIGWIPAYVLKAKVEVKWPPRKQAHCLGPSVVADIVVTTDGRNKVKGRIVVHSGMPDPPIWDRYDGMPGMMEVGLIGPNYYDHAYVGVRCDVRVFGFHWWWFSKEAMDEYVKATKCWVDGREEQCSKNVGKQSSRRSAK